MPRLWMSLRHIVEVGGGGLWGDFIVKTEQKQCFRRTVRPRVRHRTSLVMNSDVLDDGNDGTRSFRNRVTLVGSIVRADEHARRCCLLV